jgi:uncharacterized membrane protein HdeD (DUF308 family)
MKNLIHRLSGSLIISGTLNLLFGILALMWPGITLVILVWMFAIAVILQGIYLLISTIRLNKEMNCSWIFFLLAFLNIIAGIVSLVFPHITAYFLIMLMGLTWLASGFLEIVAAFQLRKEIRNEGWLALIGLISVLSGLFVIINPGAGALALLWLIAVYAILFGLGLLMLGFRAKKWTNMDDLAMWAE